MKAMIFAAGMGTRLMPLTLNKPKALVEVNGTPMLEVILKKLINSGYQDIIVNVHHFANQVVDFIESKNRFGINIQISDETNELLDTGGGLKNASWFFDDGNPFLVHNVDVLCNINLIELSAFHFQSDRPLTTLAVKDRTTSRSLLVNKDGHLRGWRNNKTGETKFCREDENFTPIAFHGIQMIEPVIFKYMTETGVFSMTDVYLRLAREHTINTYRKDNDLWMDMGTTENLAKAEAYLSDITP